MIIPQDRVAEFAGEALQIRNAEQGRLRRISRYVDGKHDPPFAPKGASNEYRWIMKKSVRNFMPLIVSVLSQNLHVDGYRHFGQETIETASMEDADPAWEAFRANRMISRQHGVHRSVIKYGSAYVIVLPGEMATGDDKPKDMPVLRPKSPRALTALYADDIDDEWPMMAIETQVMRDSTAPGQKRLIVAVYDEANRYMLTGPASDDVSLVWAKPDDPLLNGIPPVSSHDLGVCPVVRFMHEADLDGESDCTGEVQPLMLIQDQINFDTFNLMITEQFAAFMQRWVTGMDATDSEGREQAPFRPGVDRVWVAEDPASRFGEFSASPLSPYLDSRDAGIRHMSTISQVPPYHLLGQIANLSAEALAAARDGLDRKIEELQAVNTDPWRNVFRLIALAAGDQDGWNELNGTVIWRDTSARSFAATIDALGKAAQMLQVPVQELWRRIPGVTADDVEAWKTAALRAQAVAAVNAAMNSAPAVPGQPGGGAPLAANPSALQRSSPGIAGTTPPGTPPPTVPGGPPVGTPNAAGSVP